MKSLNAGCLRAFHCSTWVSASNMAFSMARFIPVSSTDETSLQPSLEGFGKSRRAALIQINGSAEFLSDPAAAENLSQPVGPRHSPPQPQGLPAPNLLGRFFGDPGLQLCTKSGQAGDLMVL